MRGPSDRPDGRNGETVARDTRAVSSGPRSGDQSLRDLLVEVLGSEVLLVGDLAELFEE
jgi:hypothetical protein